MTEACQYLHDVFSSPAPQARGSSAGAQERIYVLFEKGEEAHGGDRIVRVGTHRGQNNLPGRIREHLYRTNKDRSIFRKHVGRCLLAKADDPFLSQWDLDLRRKASRILHKGKVNKAPIAGGRSRRDRYMVKNFSFAVLRFDDEADRRQFEASLLSTIYACPVCGPSEAWLGKCHPNSEVIRQCGLWNVQSLGAKFSLMTRRSASLKPA